MSENSSNGLLAIDVGSSRVKLGWFPLPSECTSAESKPALLPIAAPVLPQPEFTLAVSHDDVTNLQLKINAWRESIGIGEPEDNLQCVVASVHPIALDAVQQVFKTPLRVFSVTDLPIVVLLDQPERVGVDRLLNAVAVNQLRNAGQRQTLRRAAIIVDLGTACTVDWITPEGAFAGGAILPGSNLSAFALHAGTAALPDLSIKSPSQNSTGGVQRPEKSEPSNDFETCSKSPSQNSTGGVQRPEKSELSNDFETYSKSPSQNSTGGVQRPEKSEPSNDFETYSKSRDKGPAIIGKSTQEAISSGLYWGMIGAVRELVARMSENQINPPQLFITGGGAPRLVSHLASDSVTPRHIPNLVLSGIALASQNLP